MKTKVTKTKKTVEKASVTVDPFVEAVEAKPAKKAAPRKAAAAKTVTAVKTEAPKKAARKTAKPAVLDPFAEIAVSISSPPYEGGVAAASADGVVLTATAGTIKKTTKKATKKPISSPPYTVEALGNTGMSFVPERGVAAASADGVVLTSPVKKPKTKSEFAAVADGVVLTATAKTVKKTIKKSAKPQTLDITAEIAAAEPQVELSPVFKALADVALPELKRENRARLQMQTPTRLYFYWSIREDPWRTLRNVFGDDMGSYALVVKLIDKQTGRETISQCEAEGNWWFNVEPDGEYRAEIGFYAPNRPYFRIVYSNTISTPRRSPSPRAASESTWTVSANKFAEVLDVAGFSRDAFDVAMAGDDVTASSDASHTAFTQLIGNNDNDLRGISAEEIRYALVALASGTSLEELRFRVSPALFAILQSNAASIEAGRAMSALTEYFDIDETEWTEEQFGPAVYGASLVNFPRTLKTKTLSPKYSPRYNPVSSHSIR